ncbi:MAG TPA: ABC transporter ATP-binding protein [Candidatus Hydrogenedentes bacterium]|nr:ABC transporter ATP-binding protein [Candidatus Hydrogenedentota bacterium]HNT86225.1 ABC transporter ATP-binding protein [Candidatus Hydrogenedentota bacterium]
MDAPLIVLEDVCFAYDAERPVLRGVDFRLERGRRIGLTGANGSGKSTFLKLIVGLLRPTRGRVCVLGEERRVEREFLPVRQRVGFLFQDPDDQLFCPTVEEDVAFGPLNQGRPPAEVRELVTDALAVVGLEGFEHRITYRLSGGEKRLVALAGVLAMRPEILLLDEPVAGLDEAAQARITATLCGLRHEMIIVSHDQQFLDATATTTLHIRDGRVQA